MKINKYICIKQIDRHHDGILALEGDELYLKDDTYYNLKTKARCCDVGSEYEKRIEIFTGFRIIKEEFDAIVICDKCNGSGINCIWCNGNGRLNKIVLTKLEVFTTKEKE